MRNRYYSLTLTFCWGFRWKWPCVGSHNGSTQSRWAWLGPFYFGTGCGYFTAPNRETKTVTSDTYGMGVR